MRLFFFFFVHSSFFIVSLIVCTTHKSAHIAQRVLYFFNDIFSFIIFFPLLLFFFFFFNFPRLIRFHSFHSPIPLSFSNTCSMRFYFIYLLFCFFPLISKESYSQYQRMLLFERFCFVSFFVTISIFLSLSLSLSLVFLSARDMIYMFWMSCRVASISSCSNLFFSLSAARSSGKITGQRVAAHAHQDTKWTRSDFLDHRNTLKGLQRVRKETCRSLSKCILHTRRRDTTILRHCYFRSSSSSTLVLKSANT